jgi:hypothetical protein
MRTLAQYRRPLFVLLVLSVLAAYVFFVVAPGPRRVGAGVGWSIALAVLAFGIGVGAMRPRRVLYAAGMSAILLAFAMATFGWEPEFLAGWTFAITLAIGCIAVGASAWSWWTALGTYFGAGGWTLLLLVIREGPAYLPAHPNDIDSVFWTVIFPVTLWPHLTFAMLGAFGIDY